MIRNQSSEQFFIVNISLYSGKNKGTIFCNIVPIFCQSMTKKMTYDNTLFIAIYEKNTSSKCI